MCIDGAARADYEFALPCAEYVAELNGEPERGPYTGAQLLSLARQRRIDANSRLYHAAKTNGKRNLASSIAQLKEVFDGLVIDAELGRSQQSKDDFVGQRSPLNTSTTLDLLVQL